MKSHRFGGVMVVALASIILLTFTLSFGVPSSYGKVASDNVFWFTGTPQDFSLGATAVTTYELWDERDPPPDFGSGTVLVNEELCWSTDLYPSSGTNTANTLDTATWNIILYYTSPKAATGAVSIEIIGSDGTTVVNSAITTANIPKSDVLTSITIDFTTLWTSKSDAYDLTSRYLAVHWSSDFKANNKFTLYYSYTTSSERTIMNTGYVIPENLLGFLFLAPFIPITAKAFARWLKKEKPLATHEGERRGKR